MYHILPYTVKHAKELGVKIEPSNRKHKKIKVIEPTGKIYHIGDIRYKDYPTYKKYDGKSIADFHRYLYLNRHKSDFGKTGFYAKNLLW